MVLFLECGAFWIIPADAGSTSNDYAEQQLAKDHPRGCGEHMKMIVPAPYKDGSSPRMRGAPVFVNPPYGRKRIIPADAGSTFRQGRHARFPWDHPRGSGEHENSRGHGDRRRGSSPRMRGAQENLILFMTPEGIIPADAGSTSFLLRPLLPCKDHPRGCGEHMAALLKSTPMAGSSPRMRGARKFEVS